MYNNFEISLVVFMPNITTNHAITYTNSFKSVVILTWCSVSCCNTNLVITSHLHGLWFSSGPREGVLEFMFAGYVLLASQSPYPIIVYFWANYRPHLTHFLENVIFAIPTYSLSIYASTLSMWFQAAECNAVNASLSLNLINNNFLTF